MFKLLTLCKHSLSLSLSLSEGPGYARVGKLHVACSDSELRGSLYSPFWQGALSPKLLNCSPRRGIHNAKVVKEKYSTLGGRRARRTTASSRLSAPTRTHLTFMSVCPYIAPNASDSTWDLAVGSRKPAAHSTCKACWDCLGDQTDPGQIRQVLFKLKTPKSCDWGPPNSTRWLPNLSVKSDQKKVSPADVRM